MRCGGMKRKRFSSSGGLRDASEASRLRADDPSLKRQEEVHDQQHQRPAAGVENPPVQMDARRRICSRMARTGRSMPDISTIRSVLQAARSRRDVARRVGVHGGERAVVAGVHGLEHVQRLAARHSPTTMRSGRMRRALRTRSRMVMAPRPSMLGGRASSGSRGLVVRRSSAASSMVTMRSSSGQVAAEHVQQRGLARAGAAGHDDVLAQLHAGIPGTRRWCRA
jgi:hypothetical protein